MQSISHNMMINFLEKDELKNVTEENYVRTKSTKEGKIKTKYEGTYIMLKQNNYMLYLL